MIIRSADATATGPTSVIETYVSGVGSASPEARSVIATLPHRLREDDAFDVKIWELSMARIEERIENLLVSNAA